MCTTKPVADSGKLLNGFNYNSRAFFYISVGGLCVALVREFYRGRQQPEGSLFDRAPHHAIILAPVVYFGFCMIDIQSAPDLIPFYHSSPYSPRWLLYSR